MYFHKTPRYLSYLFPGLTWSVKTKKKELFLTFDDGPVPEVTDFAINTLNDFGAKGTFFCVGHNIQKHPEVFQLLVDNKFSVGNHTFHHLDAWKTKAEHYLADTAMCTEQMNEFSVFNFNRKLFRPPYGKLTPAIVRNLAPQFEIIMWDNLTGDFDRQLNPETCLKKAIKNTTKGSVVIFHDSLKAEKNLQYVLPRYLEHFAEQGFSFLPL